jgi:hypothetical protein
LCVDSEEKNRKGKEDKGEVGKPAKANANMEKFTLHILTPLSLSNVLENARL